MNKNFLLLAVMSLLLPTMFVSAQANQAQPATQPAQEVTYSGKVTVSNRRFAELQTSSGVVYLGLMPHAINEANLKDGDTITVKGTKMTPRNENMAKQVNGFVVRVSSFDFNGKTYVVSHSMKKGGRHKGNMNHDEMMKNGGMHHGQNTTTK